jgi:hypothetical protein
MRVRAQASTRRVSTRTILYDPAFERGLRSVREGLPFDDKETSWEYERGRQYGHLVPLDFQTRKGGKINPVALEILRTAFFRNWIR